jgi:hypothetical protein
MNKQRPPHGGLCCVRTLLIRLEYLPDRCNNIPVSGNHTHDFFRGGAEVERPPQQLTHIRYVYFCQIPWLFEHKIFIHTGVL